MSGEHGTDPSAVIANYREAFSRANGCDVQIGYSRGWYAIYVGGYVQTRHRRSDLEAMTARLIEQVKVRPA